MTAIHVQHTDDSTAPQPSEEARDYGPRKALGEPRRCRTCGRPVPARSRRHECARCGVAASRGLTVDGPCVVCGLADRRVLGRVELADCTVSLCANHRAIAGRLGLTLAELRAEALQVVAGGAAA